MNEKFEKEQNIKFCLEVCQTLKYIAFPKEAISEAEIVLDDNNGVLNDLLLSPYNYLILGIEPQSEEVPENFLELIAHPMFPWVRAYLAKTHLDEMIIEDAIETRGITELTDYLFEMQIVADAMISFERIKPAETALLIKVSVINAGLLLDIFLLCLLYFDYVQDKELMKRAFADCKERLEKEVQQNNN